MLQVREGTYIVSLSRFINVNTLGALGLEFSLVSSKTLQSQWFWLLNASRFDNYIQFDETVRQADACCRLVAQTSAFERLFDSLGRDKISRDP